MTSRRTRGLFALAVASCVAAGCVNSYHLEYHPETSYRFIQNVRHSMVVENVLTLVSPAQSSAGAASSARDGAPAPGGDRAPHPGREGLPPAAREATRAPAAGPPALHVEGPTAPALQGPGAQPRPLLTGVPSKPAGAELDAQLSASCLANDLEACRKLASGHVRDRRRPADTAAAAGAAALGGTAATDGAALADTAALTGKTFDMTVRGFAWRSAKASIAGSNGGVSGSGPRLALDRF